MITQPRRSIVLCKSLESSSMSFLTALKEIREISIEANENDIKINNYRWIKNVNRLPEDLIKKRTDDVIEGEIDPTLFDTTFKKDVEKTRTIVQSLKEDHRCLLYIDIIKYKIGLITSSDIEFEAIKALLENQNSCESKGYSKVKKYISATVPARNGGEHHVILSKGGTGINMAMRAALLIDQFPNLESIIMVDIAGGVPRHTNSEEHVRLGDIVVSDENGATPYDFDKIALMHPPRPPSSSLLEAVNDLMGIDDIIEARRWINHIERGMKKLKLKFPAPYQDILKNESNEMIDHPVDGKRVDGQPRVFIGPIACSKVPKDPIIRNRIRDGSKIKAIMDCSDIADATYKLGKGYLVIGGICNYCDSYDYGEWKGYAAVVAAAYTRGLIESIDSPN